MMYAIYSYEDGVIDRILNAPSTEFADRNAGEGYGYVEYPYDVSEVESYKVNTATKTIESKTTQSITATPTSISADGSSKSVLSGIANGSRADIYSDSTPGKVVSIPGNKLNFCTDEVGDHDIVFSHPGYLDTTVTITATAP